MKLFKKYCIVLIGLVLSNVAVAHSKEISPHNHPLPNESLFYAAMFDDICTATTTYQIKPSWTLELKDQLPYWQALWNKEGMLLLETTTQLVGRQFAQKNFQVALSLCSFPSMSAPLIVNARYALKSFIHNPISSDVLINTIYHEILHNYLDSFLPENTPLLVKYSKESPDVLKHLHLFALEKAVYKQLSWKSILEAVILKDNSLPNGDYKRAWEIVNKKENYEDFIAELKEYKNSSVIHSYEI